jgi:uncharacterized cupredoxin-like copper-binding protein
VKHVSLVTFIVLPLLVACSGATSAPPSGAARAKTATQQLTLEAMDNMRFEPATLNARAGQPIQLTLDNTGQIVHDFRMTEGVAQPVTATAQPGQKATVTFTVPRPGTYTFVCSQPGHEQAGMKGTLVVQ